MTSDSSLQALLASASPRFPLKKSWPVAIRSARAWGRRAGIRPRLGGRADVDRLLALEDVHPAVAGALKAALAAVVAKPDDDDAAEALNNAVDRVLPHIARGLVPVEVTGLPLGFGPSDLRSLCGLVHPLALLEPLEAALLVRRVDGLLLGGSRLRVDVDLCEHRVLPALPRNLRAAPGPRDRGPLWLDQVDDEGTWSLTPRAIATAQARSTLGSSVIDLGCGCGGNTVAFAQAGFEVVAIDRDPERCRLLRANLEQRDLTAQVTVRTGLAADLLPAALERDPDAAVFIDPPWGGPDWPRRPIAWAELIAPLGVDTELLRSGSQLVVKAPRTFDLTTLPKSGHWTVRYDFGENEDDRNIVKCITLTSWTETTKPER